MVDAIVITIFRNRKLRLREGNPLCKAIQPRSGKERFATLQPGSRALKKQYGDFSGSSQPEGLRVPSCETSKK